MLTYFTIIKNKNSFLKSNFKLWPYQRPVQIRFLGKNPTWDSSQKSKEGSTLISWAIRSSNPHWYFLPGRIQLIFAGAFSNQGRICEVVSALIPIATVLHPSSSTTLFNALPGINLYNRRNLEKSRHVYRMPTVKTDQAFKQRHRKYFLLPSSHYTSHLALHRCLSTYLLILLTINNSWVKVWNKNLLNQYHIFTYPSLKALKSPKKREI